MSQIKKSLKKVIQQLLPKGSTINHLGVGEKGKKKNRSDPPQEKIHLRGSPKKKYCLRGLPKKIMFGQLNPKKKFFHVLWHCPSTEIGRTGFGSHSVQEKKKMFRGSQK